MAAENNPQGNLLHLYREAIRRHAAQPVGYRQVIEATHRHEEYNPLCGDRIEIALQVAEDRIEAAAFDGEACAICMASASLLCEHVVSQPVAHLRDLQRRLDASLHDDATEGVDFPLAPLLGVKPFPSRVRCATLPWTAALRALAK